MEYALKKFKERIVFINKQLHSQSLAKELRKVLVGKELGEEERDWLNNILANITDEKVYQYTASIISLYGGLESFVEAISEEYLKGISSLFPSYETMKDMVGLPDYMSNGLELLNHAEVRKFKDLPKKSVLVGLYKAIVNDDSSALHSEAFIDFSGGNYRHKTIMDCFRHLGAKDVEGKLKDFDPLCNYITLMGIDPSSNLFTKVDDLVERRNELAHGTDTLELMDSEPFSEYLTFLSIYAETINNYLDNELKHYEWGLVQSDVIEPRVFRNNIIMLKAKHARVGTAFYKGQKLFVLRDGKYYDGLVANIRVGEANYERYKKEIEETEIGMQIDSRCIITKDCKVRFLP